MNTLHSLFPWQRAAKIPSQMRQESSSLIELDPEAILLHAW